MAQRPDTEITDQPGGAAGRGDGPAEAAWAGLVPRDLIGTLRETITDGVRSLTDVVSPPGAPSPTPTPPPPSEPAPEPTPPDTQVAAAPPETATDATPAGNSDGDSGSTAEAEAEEEGATTEASDERYTELFAPFDPVQNALIEFAGNRYLLALGQTQREALTADMDEAGRATFEHSLTVLKANVEAQEATLRAYGVDSAALEALERELDGFNPETDSFASLVTAMGIKQDELSEEEKAYIEEQERYRDQLALRQAIAERGDGSVNQLAIDLSATVNPPVSSIQEVLTKAPETMQRSIDTLAQLRDQTTGQPVFPRLNASAELREDTAFIYTALVMHEAIETHDRWGDFTGDPEARAVDLVYGAAGGGDAIWQFVTGAIDGSGEGFEAALEAGSQEFRQAMGETGLQISSRQAIAIQATMSDYIAAASPHFEPRSAYLARMHGYTLDEAIVQWMQQERPDMHAQLKQATAALGEPYEEGEIAITALINWTQEHVPEISRGSYAMTGTLNRDPELRATQVALALDNVNDGTVAGLLFNANVPVNPGARLAPHTVDSYDTAQPQPAIALSESQPDGPLPSNPGFAPIPARSSPLERS